MKRGIFFTIEAVMVIGLIAIILTGQSIIPQTNYDTHLTKSAIDSMTATYTDKNNVITNSENTYCKKVLVFDNTIKQYKENFSCGDFK